MVDQARPVRPGHQKSVAGRSVAVVARAQRLRDRALAGLSAGVMGHGRGGGGVKVWRVRLPETTRSLTREKFPLNRIC